MSDQDRKLVEQDQALASFFDSLMRDVDAYARQESHEPAMTPAPLPEATPVSLPATKQVDEPPSPSIFTPLPAVATDTDTPTTSLAPEETAEALDAEEVKADTVADESGRPAWAEQAFQAMLFSVGGLTLAVPLADLNGIVEWHPDQITEMPGHAAFYLGLMPHHGRSIPVVDTAQLVLPQQCQQAVPAEERVTRVVLIHDGQYGLACDQVSEVITLDPGAVRWRSTRTQRRWLAGTVIEQMCALIDADAFAELLAGRAPMAAFRG